MGSQVSEKQQPMMGNIRKQRKSMSLSDCHSNMPLTWWEEPCSCLQPSRRQPVCWNGSSRSGRCWWRLSDPACVSWREWKQKMESQENDIIIASCFLTWQPCFWVPENHCVPGSPLRQYPKGIYDLWPSYPHSQPQHCCPPQRKEPSPEIKNGNDRHTIKARQLRFSHPQLFLCFLFLLIIAVRELIDFDLVLCNFIQNLKQQSVIIIGALRISRELNQGEWMLTVFLNSLHSSTVSVSALAMRGMMLTLSCNLFMNSMSKGFKLQTTIKSRTCFIAFFLRHQRITLRWQGLIHSPVTIGRDEVETAMDPGIRHGFPVHSGFSIEVAVILVLDVLCDRIPAGSKNTQFHQVVTD